LQPEYRCPLCQAEISIEDVNVATDLALCRSCGKTSAFSVVSSSTGIRLANLDNPPRWIRVDEELLGGTTIVYRKRSPVLFFLIPFTLVWSGGSIGGIYVTQLVRGKFDLSQSLFGLPFLAGTVVLLAVIAFLLLGRWAITLRDGEGTVFVGVGGLGWTRHFRYGRDTLVSLRATSLKVNGVPQQGILVRNGNEDFVFGALLKDEAKQYVGAAIMRAASTA
jgi:hypothetical protein